MHELILCRKKKIAFSEVSVISGHLLVLYNMDICAFWNENRSFESNIRKINLKNHPMIFSLKHQPSLQTCVCAVFLFCVCAYMCICVCMCVYVFMCFLCGFIHNYGLKVFFFDVFVPFLLSPSFFMFFAYKLPPYFPPRARTCNTSVNTRPT